MPHTPTTVTVLIPLPRFYNADETGAREPIEDDKYTATCDEIATALYVGGWIYKFDEGKAEGFWWHKGIVGYDVQALLEVDVEDTAANRAWFRRYAKEVLKPRFRQIAIYLKFVAPVDTLEVSDETIT